MFPFDTKEPFEPKDIPVSAKTPDGDTPLHLASHWGDLKAIKLLIDAGANIDAKGDMGYTPLATAVTFGQVEAAKLLIKFGAKPSIKTEFGKSPYEIAMAEGNQTVKNVFNNIST